MGKLFSVYYPVLLKYGSKFCPGQELLEDCIQDLFAEIWQSPSSPEIQSVKAYLLKALKYKLYKKLRQRPPGSYVEGAANEMAFEISHENFLIEQEDNEQRIRQVIDTLRQLQPRQREIIYLKIFQELSYEEVGEIMNINYQVTRNLMSQAIKALRKLLLLFSTLSVTLIH